jgi:hypothetical protein
MSYFVALPHIVMVVPSPGWRKPTCDAHLNRACDVHTSPDNGSERNQECQQWIRLEP